jgi:hypothetical protein
MIVYLAVSLPKTLDVHRVYIHGSGVYIYMVLANPVLGVYIYMVLANPVLVISCGCMEATVLPLWMKENNSLFL